MHDLGLVLLQIITRQCDTNGNKLVKNGYQSDFKSDKRVYTFDENDLSSGMSIFVKVHSNSEYFSDDSDLGVLEGIYKMTEYMETMDEKNVYL